MVQKYSLNTKLGPSIGSSFRNWLKLVISNGSIALKHYPRVLLVDLITSFGIPFRMIEHWRSNKKVENMYLKSDPIFIIGHWRSGTTFLHNFMCQDPQFGFITMLQAAFPKAFNNKIIQWLMKKAMPQRRPMDNMEMGLYLAQEEEMALGNLFPYSFYNAWYFPKKMMEFYYKYIRFKNITQKLMEKWKNMYIYLLKLAAYNMGGKQLILKNPANTARIKFLLDLFPDAKFIHIYRNPYTVYLSTVHFYNKAIEGFMLQNVAKEEIHYNILRLYREIMISYFNEKKFVPKNNLIEVRYEDFESNPITQLNNIYSRLNLIGFSNNISKFKSYLKYLNNYKKNSYELTESIIEKVEKFWSFALKKWDYEIPYQYYNYNF